MFLMAYISATTGFEGIMFIMKFTLSDECFSAIKVGGNFSLDLPFKSIYKWDMLYRYFAQHKSFYCDIRILWG